MFSLSYVIYFLLNIIKYVLLCMYNKIFIHYLYEKYEKLKKIYNFGAPLFINMFIEKY